MNFEPNIQVKINTKETRKKLKRKQKNIELNASKHNTQKHRGLINKHRTYIKISELWDHIGSVLTKKELNYKKQEPTNKL